LGLRNETKVVLIFLTISALLGFTQVPIAEGAVSWNGFLREIGFNPPTVYEVSDVSVIPAGGSSVRGDTVQLRCLDGDWMSLGNDNDPAESIVMSTDDPALEGLNLTIVGFGSIVYESDAAVNQNFKKPIGWDGQPRRNTIFDLFDIRVTMTILCFSPSSFMAVGGEWQATDTTALIIGYSVLNAYWIAPIGIGIGLGIYLVKRRF